MRAIELDRTTAEELVELLESCDPKKEGAWRHDLAGDIRRQFGMVSLAQELARRLDRLVFAFDLDGAVIQYPKQFNSMMHALSSVSHEVNILETQRPGDDHEITRRFQLEKLGISGHTGFCHCRSIDEKIQRIKDFGVQILIDDNNEVLTKTDPSVCRLKVIKP